MESVNADELNKYITKKKELYDLLSSEEIGFYLPPFNSPCLTVNQLLKIGNKEVNCPLKKDIKIVDKKKLLCLSKGTLYE